MANINSLYRGTLENTTHFFKIAWVLRLQTSNEHPVIAKTKIFSMSTPDSSQ